jgi:excisionase family DNA binding protein
MSVREIGRPPQPRLAALEAPNRDLRDGEVRHVVMSSDQGDTPWPERHSPTTLEGAVSTTDSSPIAPLIRSFEQSPALTECAAGEPLLLTPEQAARRLSVGRTTVYTLMASGELLSVNIGRCRRVPPQRAEVLHHAARRDRGTDRRHR